MPELTAEELRRILKAAAQTFVSPAARTATAAKSARRGPAAKSKRTATKRSAPAGAYTMFTDGAARGNPGPAGLGVVIYDPNGQVVQEICRYLGTQTNNVAEYEALVEGLTVALELGIQHLEVQCDSELVCHQMNGVYAVKHPRLAPLHQSATQAAEQFETFRIRHVRRAYNQQADALANRAVDSRAR